MSSMEVVKTLKIILDYEFKNKDNLTKYNNSAKELKKTQVESNKATEKGLSLKQKEKELLKQETALKKQAIIEENKLKIAQIKNQSNAKQKILKTEEKQEKDRQKRVEKFNESINKLETKRAKEATKTEERTARIKEKLSADIDRRNAIREANYRLNQRRQQDEYLRNQDAISRRNKDFIYDKQLNRGVASRESTFDTRMNNILGRKGKMLTPDGRITWKPLKDQTPDKPILPRFDKEQLGQTITTTAQNIGQKTQDIIMSSIDIMLEYEKRLNELQVRGELKPKQLKDMDKAVKDSAQKWGTNILDTQSIGVNLAKTGLQGDMLKFMIEESTMLGRSLGTTPEEAQKILNMTLHQQRENIQTPEARKKGTPITQDKEAIKKASNMLSAAVNYSALDTKDLIYYTKYSGTSAGEKGVSFEEYLSNAMVASNKGMIGSTPGTSERKIQQRLYSSLSGMMETQNFKVGKKKGKKGNRLEQAYDLRDFIDKDVSKYAGQDKTGKNYFNQELLLLDLAKGMKKKKLSVLEQANIVEEIGGLTAMEMLTALLKKKSAEEEKMRKGLQDAQKNDETRRTATGLMQNPKSKLEQTKTKKDIAMINLGQKFKPEVNAFTGASNRALDVFNKDEKVQENAKQLSIGLMGTGAVAGIGAGLGAVTGAGAVAGALPALGFAGAFIALHDSIAFLKGDEMIITSLGKTFDSFFNLGKNNSTANAINQTRDAIQSLSNTLQNAVAGIEQFIPSYQTLGKLGMVNLGANVQIPYLPGQAPPAPQGQFFRKNPYEVPHTNKVATANKSTAKKKTG